MQLSSARNGRTVNGLGEKKKMMMIQQLTEVWFDNASKSMPEVANLRSAHVALRRCERLQQQHTPHMPYTHALYCPYNWNKTPSRETFYLLSGSFTVCSVLTTQIDEFHYQAHTHKPVMRQIQITVKQSTTMRTISVQQPLLHKTAQFLMPQTPIL